MDGRQEIRIRRVMKRLGAGWAIDNIDANQLGGWCYPWTVRDKRKDFRVSGRDMTELIRRQLIQPEPEGLADWIIADAGERYLRVVK